VIEGCEAAWRFFGGVFRVLIPEGASAIVAEADAVNLRFTVGWLDYTQHCGFATDAARVSQSTRPTASHQHLRPHRTGPAGCDLLHQTPQPTPAAAARGSRPTSTPHPATSPPGNQPLR